MKIRVLTHSSLKIEGDGRVIYVDPFRIRDKSHDADYILVTHDHFDHLSPDDIAKVRKDDTIIVIPESISNSLKDADSRIVTLKPNDTTTVNRLQIEAVPAYNIGRPFHPKGNNWIGYIVEVEGKRIYIAGDTDATKDNRKVKCEIALVPVGGKYTMDAKQAAELVNEISPELAIPTHYGSVAGRKDDADVFKSNVHDPICVEIRMEY